MVCKWIDQFPMQNIGVPMAASILGQGIVCIQHFISFLDIKMVMVVEILTLKC